MSSTAESDGRSSPSDEEPTIRGVLSPLESPLTQEELAAARRTSPTSAPQPPLAPRHLHFRVSPAHSGLRPVLVAIPATTTTTTTPTTTTGAQAGADAALATAEAAVAAAEVAVAAARAPEGVETAAQEEEEREEALTVDQRGELVDAAVVTTTHREAGRTYLQILRRHLQETVGDEDRRAQDHSILVTQLAEAMITIGEQHPYLALWVIEMLLTAVFEP